MTIRVSTDVFCDFCENWIHGLVASQAKHNAARRNAKLQGWAVHRMEYGKLKDMCPNCTPPNVAKSRGE